MFCPKCSQQQLSDEVRFCSRCGFQLAAVSEILRNDGTVLVNSASQTEKSALIKRPELRAGGKVIFLSICLFVPAFIVGLIIDHPIPLVVPVIAFFIGLIQILYYFIFGESILPVKKQNQTAFNNAEPQLNFRPAQGLPFSVVETKSLNTAEFGEPMSVTERTTNLLERK